MGFTRDLASMNFSTKSQTAPKLPLIDLLPIDQSISQLLEIM